MAWSDFAVPILESGAGGLAQMQGARERDARRQHELSGYATALTEMAKTNPQLKPFADAIAAGAPADAMFSSAQALYKGGDPEAKRKTLLQLAQARALSDPSDSFAKTAVTILSQQGIAPEIVEKMWPYFEPKERAPAVPSIADIAAARVVGLDPNNLGNLSPKEAEDFIKARNTERPELPPWVGAPMATATGAPAIPSAPRTRGGGLGPVTLNPVAGAEFKLTPEQQLRKDFADKYLREHPNAPIEDVARAYEATKRAPKLLAGENGAAALAVGLPLDQSDPKWKEPGASDKWQKKLDEYLSGKKSSKLTNADQIAVAGSLHLPLDPAIWTSEQEAKWIAESPKLLGNMAAIRKGPGATTPWWTGKGWKSLPKGVAPTDPTWRKNAPKVDEAISKGYITKNVNGETYGIDKKTGLAYDLAQQRPDGLITIMEPRPDLAARKQQMLDQTKISGAQWAGGPGGHIVARGIDGAKYQLSYDKANDRYVWEPWTGK